MLRVGKALGVLASGWLDLLAPPRCADCGTGLERHDASESPAVLCRSCQARLPHVSCTCHRPAPGRIAEACPACSGWGADLPQCRASVIYGAGSEPWVVRFKYPRRGLAGLDPTARRVLEEWVRTAARRRPGPPPDAVVPVPLHARRLRERGFNPAALLAYAVARELGSRVAPPGLLVRLRDTPTQTRLDRRARQANVAGAFGSARPREIAARRLLLVDDVATTGATLVEASRALRKAGARHVDAVCAARTPGFEDLRTTRSASSR